MMKQLAIAITAMILCGCGIVVSPRPVGDVPLNIQEHKSEWEGTWLSSEGAVALKVLDATNGIIEFLTYGLNQGKWNCETGSVCLREGGGWTFANYEVVDGTNALGYLWGKIEKDNRQILLWLPDSDKIEALVKAGQLPGTIEYPKDKRTGVPVKGPPLLGYSITLGDLTPEHIQRITSVSNGPMVYWQGPMALIKQSQRNDPRYLRSVQKQFLHDGK